jgi:hypothetical protein
LRELLAALGVYCQATTKTQFDRSILTIEGTARRSTGQIYLQPLGIISYDAAGKSLGLRAFNDGRFLEADLLLSDKGQGMSWGFALGTSEPIP